MAELNFTEATTLVATVTTELDGLADAASALISTELSNDASTERQVLANFCLITGTFQDARDGGNISLLIVPEGASDPYTDAIVAGIESAYIARTADGTAVSWPTDSATTAREFSVAGVQIPNCNYKVGIFNDSGGQFAASGNTLYMSGPYTTTYV